MNGPLGVCVLLSVVWSLVGFTAHAVAHNPISLTRVQYTEYILGGELYCRTLESNGVYYSIEEHVFLALLRGYVLDRYLYQDPGYSQRGDCPRIQWEKVGAVEEVTFELALVDSRRVVSLWGYEISQETVVALLQSEGFHIEFRGDTIYATR